MNLKREQEFVSQYHFDARNPLNGKMKMELLKPRWALTFSYSNDQRNPVTASCYLEFHDCL